MRNDEPLPPVAADILGQVEQIRTIPGSLLEAAHLLAQQEAERAPVATRPDLSDAGESRG